MFFKYYTIHSEDKKTQQNLEIRLPWKLCSEVFDRCGGSGFSRLSTELSGSSMGLE